jgi:hypothetical protein
MKGYVKSMPLNFCCRDSPDLSTSYILGLGGSGTKNAVKDFTVLDKLPLYGVFPLFSLGDVI